MYLQYIEHNAAYTYSWDTLYEGYIDAPVIHITSVLLVQQWNARGAPSHALIRHGTPSWVIGPVSTLALIHFAVRPWGYYGRVMHRPQKERP